jgi:hypothetical protein
MSRETPPPPLPDQRTTRQAEAELCRSGRERHRKQPYTVDLRLADHGRTSKWRRTPAGNRRPVGSTPQTAPGPVRETRR